MTTTVDLVRAVVDAPVEEWQADTLRALAEASVGGPANASLIARLNPAYPCKTTRAALEDLREGLAEARTHPLTPLLTAYSLTGAGRRWVHQHG